MIRLCLSMAAAALLVACGEQPQTTNAAVKKTDAQAFQGADNRFVANGWKAGDKASWEEQLRARARGQNEYIRIAHK
jgi:hypothetical protein